MLANSQNTVQTSLFSNNTINFSGTDLPPQVGDVVTVNSNADPSDIYGNIFLDPEFVNPDTGNYALQSTSPAINAGDIDSLDLDGTIADIGVYFTTSATEAINAAFLFSTVASGAIVASPSLHPAVEHAVARSGAREVRTVRLDADGGIDLDTLRDETDSSVSAVVVEHVQNETGRIQDIAEIGAIIKKTGAGRAFYRRYRSINR